MGFSRGWYILFSIPVTIFLFVLYVSFLTMSFVEYGILLVVLYTILSFDFIVDDVFRKNFILLLCNSVQQTGRAVIYLFMAIILIIGPIHDIHHNIIFLLNYTKSGIDDKEVQEIVNIKQNLFEIIDTHINENLLASLKPYCQKADEWNHFMQKSPNNLCSFPKTHNDEGFLGNTTFAYLLDSLFNYGTYHASQRASVVTIFIYCSFVLVFMSRRFREDISYKNYFVNNSVRELDTKDLENRTPFDDADDDYASDEERLHRPLADRRMFKSTLPLTSLERKELYILTDQYRYLNREIWRLLDKLSRFTWIFILFVTIYYFDFTIVLLIKENVGNCISCLTQAKYVRFTIACVYLIIAALFIVFEPLIKRVHHRLLEAFYPEVATRRARILMEMIRENRKSFIEINRLNIHLRFNKTGNIWTAIRSFVEDTSLADCLGRPSGLFCSICETEARLPKYARRCSTYSCIGVYCMDCYEQIRFICLYCNKIYDETKVVHIHAFRGKGHAQ